MSGRVTPVWAEEAYAHLIRSEPKMAALVDRLGPMRPVVVESKEGYFSRLVRAIVGQQISGKAAAAIYGRLEERCGLPLSPKTVHHLSDEEIRGCGFSGNKLLSLRDLTERSLDGRLDLEHLETLPDNEVTEQLVAVRGIGKWTADMFLMFALGRPDVLPAEDLGIQNAVEKLYELDAHPTPKVVKKYAEEGGWRPFSSAACFYLWDSLR